VNDQPTPPEAHSDHGRTALTDFQIDVARAFFATPAAEGFLLAGGAALAAHGLTRRPTQDLDLFTSPGRGVVSTATMALEAVAGQRGWTVRAIQRSETFARLVITGPDESVLVDLAVDATPERPGTVSVAGPTLDPDDLAARKVIALFDRAEARDFTDVHALAARYGTERLLEMAAVIDRGFDRTVFADMLESLTRFEDDELPTTSATGAVRAFFADWTRQLREPPADS
jgi:Nucleotidyl transferase AbiEii toxin, Type IV TA system